MTAVKRRFGGRKTREGTVVSDKMEQTVVVAVQTSHRHPLYKKTIRRVRKFMAHDESGDTRIGDIVRIVEIAPISRHKRWGVAEVLQKAELPELPPEQIDLEILGEVKAEEEEAPLAEATVAAAPGSETGAESSPEVATEEPQDAPETETPEAENPAAEVETDTAEVETDTAEIEPGETVANEAEVTTEAAETPEAEETTEDEEAK
jgi:small subunit ribosomal protein S17